MKSLNTDDLLSLTTNAAIEHSGSPQWFDFFIRLHQIALKGLGGLEKRLTWCDDGIIRRIFRVLGVERGFFVEIGASDGIHLSNCRALAQRGWSGCSIEADHAMAEQLRNNYRDRSDVQCLEQFVAVSDADPGASLDAIAARHFAGRHVDFLSIDINGWDYRIFEQMQLRPTVVCIEGGFSWHPEFTQRVPEEVAAQDLQQPLAVTIEIGRRKSYVPICFNQNTYFVVAELADRFAGFEKDAVSLWRDAWFNESQVFSDSLVEVRKDPLIRRLEGDAYAKIDFGGA